ncbi:MAG TPA: SDR family oxidoreductase [Patescibacteria group bacterium]|nr:SDR family oxidoreductase [Patescibacteria group bacterium]
MSNKNTILITGSSNGIGAGIAKHFGKLGYNVVVTYFKNKTNGEKVVKEIGSSSKLYELDVKDEESVKNVFSNVEKEFGKLDVLVNNAAVDYPTPFEECSFDDWKEITRTKIDGNFLCTKYAIPLLKKSDNANIIVIMSSMFERVDPDDPAYCVGTAGTVTYLKCAALALSKYKIRTNGIGPGETKTNSRYWKEVGNEEMWNEITSKNPLGRLTTPEDIAIATQIIVEDKSKFLNGNIIYVNGGGHLK